MAKWDADKMDAAMRPAVRVKPLVWIECQDGTFHDANCMYEIETDGGWWRVTKAVTGSGSYLWHRDTLEAAKAAAQSDFEARILFALNAALTPGNPTGELKRRMDEHRRERDARMKAEGMREAAKIADGYNQDPYPQTEYDRGWARSAESVSKAILDRAAEIEGGA